MDARPNVWRVCLRPARSRGVYDARTAHATLFLPYSAARMRPTSMPWVMAMPWLMPGQGSG